MDLDVMIKWNQSVLPKQWPWPRADQYDGSSLCAARCEQDLLTKRGTRHKTNLWQLGMSWMTQWCKSILITCMSIHMCIYIYMCVYIYRCRYHMHILYVCKYIYIYISYIHTSPEPTWDLGSGSPSPWVARCNTTVADPTSPHAILSAKRRRGALGFSYLAK